MTRLDVGDEEVVESTDRAGPRAILLAAREVPLGGVRAMSVRRTLPQRGLPMVGAWCFLDRFGPQTARMRVEPHPHIGLQTVTWPFVGEVRHRDSVGSDVSVSRGILNLMTSGEGIAHSEYSIGGELGEDPVPLDALQLWVALPESRRHGPPEFERHADLPEVTLPAIDGDDPANGEQPGGATVVLGRFAGITSPATAHTPIVGAEVRLPAGARVRIPLDPGWEHALLAVDGDVVVHTATDSDAAASVVVPSSDLLYLGLRRESVEASSAHGAVLFLIGGEPFDDDIVMWWNFVARSHDEIVAARDAWEAGAAPFGRVVGHGDERIPAPPLPGVRLTRRHRRI